MATAMALVRRLTPSRRLHLAASGATTIQPHRRKAVVVVVVGRGIRQRWCAGGWGLLGTDAESPPLPGPQLMGPALQTDSSGCRQMDNRGAHSRADGLDGRHGMAWHRPCIFAAVFRWKKCKEGAQLGRTVNEPVEALDSKAPCRHAPQSGQQC